MDDGEEGKAAGVEERGNPKAITMPQISMPRPLIEAKDVLSLEVKAR